MAGTDRRFNATRFREGIKFAMQMGFPDQTAQQITWRWTTERTFSKADSGGNPYTWASSQVTDTTVLTDLIVDCAVKFQPVGAGTRVAGTAIGTFDQSTVEVTMLDTDWDLLMAHSDDRLPNQAVIDDNIYHVLFVGPPLGLFDVTVYQLFLAAVDES